MLNARCLAALSAAVILPGCTSSDRSREFGDRYVLGWGGGDEVPVLNGARLRVPVSYGGGCGSHEFTLRTRTVRASATVWLHHEAGDDCELGVFTWTEVDVPASVQSAQRIGMRGPSGLPDSTEVRFPLR